MKVRDIMTQAVVSVKSETCITEVAEILFKNGFHGLPVVESGKIIGMITEDDFFVKGSSQLFLPSYINFLRETKFVDELPKKERNKIEKLLNSQAKDIMSENCVTVFPDMKVEELWEVILKTKFNTLPVANDKKELLGIVTRIDVIGLLKDRDQLKAVISVNKSQQKEREVDLAAREIISWWNKSFAFIKETQIKTWKGVFLLAFIAGMAAAIIWTISVRIEKKTDNSAEIK